MKKAITIAILVIVTGVAKAQKSAPQPPVDSVSIKLPASKLAVLQSLLQFAYNWLPKSQAPANDVSQAIQAITEIYPMLAPVKKPIAAPDVKKKQ